MALAGFESFSFSNDGATTKIYTLGSGPGVVVIHEIPASRRRSRSLLSRRGRPSASTCRISSHPGKPISTGYILTQVARASPVRGAGESGPITDWLRALCRRAHAECGGPGVGALGMCLTGNFALALMVDPAVMAPVLSQPSLPFPLTAAHRAAIHLSDDDLAVAKRRAADGCTVLGLRFTGDSAVPRERFDTLRREFGADFDAVEIDSSPGNPHGIKASAHSVLTTDLVDKEGHPTRAALDRVLGLFRDKLKRDR